MNAMVLPWVVSALSLQAAFSCAHPLSGQVSRSGPDPSFAVDVQLAGRTYTNKVRPCHLYHTSAPMVTLWGTGFGRLRIDPVQLYGVHRLCHRSHDSLPLLTSNAHVIGDTLGGIGSAIALKSGSFSQNADDSFKGTFIVQPDRGFNV